MIHQNQVKTGRYNSACAVVREALWLFEERDRIQQLQIQDLRKKINKGWASLERGQGVDGREFFRALGREERELAQKHKRDAIALRSRNPRVVPRASCP
jgi:putative addiction module CopG family antidote